MCILISTNTSKILLSPGGLIRNNTWLQPECKEQWRKCSSLSVRQRNTCFISNFIFLATLKYIGIYWWVGCLKHPEI